MKTIKCVLGIILGLCASVVLAQNTSWETLGALFVLVWLNNIGVEYVKR